MKKGSLNQLMTECAKALLGQKYTINGSSSIYTVKKVSVFNSGKTLITNTTGYSHELEVCDFLISEFE